MNEEQKPKIKNRGNQRGRFRRQREKPDFETRLLDVARVVRVTRGGKRFSFRATVVIGDMKGMVGVGVAQGKDVAQAMQKASQNARKKSIRVSLTKDSIPHRTEWTYHGASVLLKPAPTGTGVKAGGPVRVVAKLVGIENVTAKLLSRTRNKINIARATVEALAHMKSSVSVGKTS